MPTRWYEPQALILHNDKALAAIKTYMDMIPFKGTVRNKVNLIQDETNPYKWYGNAESVMEFLYTYTWGVENFARETQELYGIYTLDGWENMLGMNNFHIVHTETYCQLGYYEHLKNEAHIEDLNNNILPYPATNILIVADKLF